jgi:cysteine-S-conjugate beta-lyase
MRRVDPLLGNCSLSELRQRKSEKWQEYPSEVLPSFVAEMDFSLAEPITAAVTAAVAISDCGYAHPGQLAAAFAQFAADRLDWAPETAHVYPVPDVMAWISEVIQAITPPGSAWAPRPN